MANEFKAKHGVIAPATSITGTTPSTSNTTGALVVAGGAGLAGNLHVGGSANITGALNLTSNLNISSGNIVIDAGPTTPNSRSGVMGTFATTDQWFVGGIASAPDQGRLEIATGDNGTEPIYVRQYIGSPWQGTISNELVLLDNHGDSEFPGDLYTNGSVTANSFLQCKGALNLHKFDGNLLGSIWESGIENTLKIDVSANAANGLTLATNGGVSRLTIDNTGIVKVLSNTASNSTTTGALIVSGGIGVGGNVVSAGGFYGTFGQISNAWAGPTTFNVRNSNTHPNSAVYITVDNGGPSVGGLVMRSQTHSTPNIVSLFNATGGELTLMTANVGGSSTHRLSVYGNGEVHIHSPVNSTSSTTGSLQVHGGVGVSKDIYVGANVNANLLRLSSIDDVTLTSTAHAFQIGDTASYNMVMDYNEIQARRNNGLASDLYFNREGGNVFVGDLVATPSSYFEIRTNQTATSLASGALRIPDQGGAAIQGNVHAGSLRTYGLVTYEIPAPSDPSAAGASTGGTVVAGTYYAKIVAVDQTGAFSAASPEVSATVTGTTSKITWGWTAVAGAQAYRVYVGTTSGGQSSYFVESTNSFVQTTTVGTAGTIPTATSGRAIIAGPTSVTDTTAATSSSTGAIVVSGGAGIAGNVYAGGAINANGNIITNPGTSQSAIEIKAVNGNVGNGSYAGLSSINDVGTSIRMLAFGSNYTGFANLVGLYTNNGVPIKFWQGGQARLDIDASGNVVIANASLVSNTISSTGNLVISGSNVNVSSTSTLRVLSTSHTTSTTTGALIVSGGIGLNGNLYSGGGGTFNGSMSIGGNISTVTNITASGAILANGTGGIGYTTGAGGSVTQTTSRTTGVTLNELSGAITLFSTTTTAGLVTTFTVTNSTVAATDTPVVSVKTGAGIYFTSVSNVAAGSFKISVYTPAAVSTSEAPVLNFAVIRGTTT